MDPLPPLSGDCLVVIHSEEPTPVGTRFQLDDSPTRIGRSPDNHIVLAGDRVSRRHARLEKREERWYVLDAGSAGGTYHNDQHLAGEAVLSNGDRVKTGSTTFKFLSGVDVEGLYRAEIDRLNTLDGQTGIHHKEHFFAALDREIISCRLHDRDLAIVLFSIEEYRGYGKMQGHDEHDVLRGLADMMSPRHEVGEVFARLDDDLFALLLPEQPHTRVKERAMVLQDYVLAQPHATRPDYFPRRFYTVLLQGGDPGAEAFIKRAKEKITPVATWFKFE